MKESPKSKLTDCLGASLSSPIPKVMSKIAKPIANAAAKYATFEGCIVVQLLNDTTQKEGIIYRKCAYLSAHRCNLVTRIHTLTHEQIQQHIEAIKSQQPLSYSFFPQSQLLEYDTARST